MGGEDSYINLSMRKCVCIMMYVCVMRCLCVCKGEREGQREGGKLRV